MEQAARARTPAHLWIVGVLSLLWNCFGAYDYLMTRTRNMDYLSSMPGIDANAMLAWIDAFPLWAQFGWGLGVWGALLGSILLLMRSRYAVWAFGASLIGVVLTFGYQYLGAPPLAGMEGMMQYMPIFIALVAVALFFYARTMAARGVLR